MTGTLIGDTFGLPYENLSWKKIAKIIDMKNYLNLNENKSKNIGYKYSDDTQMTVAVANLLTSGKEFNKENLAYFLYTEFMINQIEGYSGMTYDALRKSSSGDEFLNRVNRDSVRNGAVMRSAPIGVLPNINDVIGAAYVNSEITHNTSSAIAGSIAVALSSFLFLNTDYDNSKVFEFCLDHMKGFSKDAEKYFMKLSKMKCLDRKLLFGPENENLGVPINGLKTAGAVLHLLANHDGNLTKILKDSVLLGGDTDTTASLALGIASTRGDLSTLPDFLLENCDKGPYGLDYVVSHGNKLARIMPMSVTSVKRSNYSGTRKNRIVQPLDGLLRPINPYKLESVMLELMNQVGYEKTDLIIGVDASGYIPATAACLVSKLPMVATIKAELDLPGKIKFIEPGTAHPEIFVYNIPPKSTTIIIDDEIMSGNTVLNLVDALKKEGHIVRGVVVPIESTKYGVRERLENNGIKLVSYTQHVLE